MIVAIAEISLKETQVQVYNDFASQLKPLACQIEGFISNERFHHATDHNKILSLSYWKNEESIKQFRNLNLHRLAELKSRDGIFSDYRVRIAHISRDYGMLDRIEAPLDSKTFHDNFGKQGIYGLQ